MGTRPVRDWSKYSDEQDFCKPPAWMAINILWGRCWCGKPKSGFEYGRRVHCCELHAHLWAYAFRTTWAVLRWQILKRDDYTCEVCGMHSTDDFAMEVDHVEAKCLGGDQWAQSNLRTLCVKCHKAKTASDMAKLAALRRSKIPPKNQSLDGFM